MTIFWVAQDNKKNGTFKQHKAEVLCLLGSLLCVKHFFPNYKTVIYLDKWTKKFYEQFGFLHLFDEVNTSVLDKPSKINFDMFYAASKLIVMTDLRGPSLNLDLDFFLFSDIEKIGMFDCDVSCLYLEWNEDYAYLQPERGMSLVPFKWGLPYDKDAFNVSLFYTRNGFYRDFYSSEMVRYMETVSQLHYETFPKEEYFQLNLFVDQYLGHQFTKAHNQSLRILIDDFYPIEERHHYVNSVGVHYNDSTNYCYHFGNHKQFLKNPEFNQEKSHFIYSKTKEIAGNSEVLEKLYNLPYNDYRFNLNTKKI